MANPALDFGGPVVGLINGAGEFDKTRTELTTALAVADAVFYVPLFSVFPRQLAGGVLPVSTQEGCGPSDARRQIGMAPLHLRAQRRILLGQFGDLPQSAPSVA